MKNKIIESRDNPQIKHIRKLLTDKDYRYETNRYIIEGQRFLDGVQGLEEMYIKKGSLTSSIEGVKSSVVSERAFRSVCDTQHDQGVIGVCRFSLEDVSKISTKEKYILFDRIQDPGNMGTMIRTAVAFGLNGIIVSSDCVDPFSPKVVRASAGMIAKTQVFMLKDIQEIDHCNIISADLKGKDVFDFKWPDNFVLAVGSEAHGVSEIILKNSKESVRIPIEKNVESLNAAVACGILLYGSSKR